MALFGRSIADETVSSLMATNTALMEMNNINNQRISELHREISELRSRVWKLEKDKMVRERESG